MNYTGLNGETQYYSVWIVLNVKPSTQNPFDFVSYK